MFEGMTARREKALTEIMQAKLQRQMIERLLSPNPRSRATLEDDDAANWELLGSNEIKELSATDQAALRDNATQFYYRNSHARNLLRLMVKYIVGRGFSIQPVSGNALVKKWLDTFWRVNRMELRKKEIILRAMRDGECFVRFFPDKTGMLLVRFMDPSRVAEPTTRAGVTGNASYGVETDPEDIENVLAYWYKGERIPAEDVYHIKLFVDSDVKRGRSYLEPMMKALAQYKQWLDYRIRLNAVRSVVGLVKKIAGTPDQVRTLVGTQKTKNQTAPDGTEYTAAPEGISVFTSNKGVEYEMMSPNLQASDAKEDGRNILLAVSAGAGLPEYMVTSDASNANYASTMVAEAPGVREFMDWQDFFGECFKEICTKVVLAGMKAGEIPEKEEVEVEIKAMDPLTMVKRAVKVTARQDVQTGIEVTFPELVHRDIEKETKSYVMQVGEGWMSNRTAAVRLDLDYDYEREQIEKEEEKAEEGTGTGEESAEDEEYIKARASAMQAEAPGGEEEPETAPAK